MQATAVSDAGYDRSVARDELEIERRFRLRAAPSPETLEQHGAEVYRFEQLYLVAPPPGPLHHAGPDHGHGTIILRQGLIGEQR